MWDNTRYGKNSLRDIGFDVDDTPVPIICLSTDSRNKESIDCQWLQKQLSERNIAVTYVPGGMYTSVPEGGGIHISRFCTHSEEQIDHLVDEIKRLI